MSKRFASRSKSATPGTLRVAVFCGGRGATSILRALLRTPGVHLTVLVNAYDDGLSTGRLRGFVPGMLGASDFRKNLARLLESLPALRNPTISNLSLKGWVAVETIIDEHVVRELIPALKLAGAEGIIEYPLNKVVY